MNNLKSLRNNGRSGTRRGAANAIKTGGRQLRSLLVAAILLLALTTGSVLAGEFEIAYSDSQVITFFNNETGQAVDGLRIQLEDSVEPIHYIGVGANFQLTETSGAELLFEGTCPPSGGTWQINWPTSVSPIRSAQWLVNGEVIHEINVHLPTARMVSLQISGQDLTMQFRAIGSYDSSGEPLVSYDWLWEDGETASGLAVIRSFDLPGRYLVRLTVTNARGLTASVIRKFDVEATPVEVEVVEAVLEQLLFTLDNTIYMINSDGTGLTVIYEAEGILKKTTPAPGGNGISFWTSDFGGGWFTATIVDGHLEDITNIDLGTAHAWNYANTIIFKDGEPFGAMYSIAPDGANTHQIASDRVWYSFRLSPDGTQLLASNSSRELWLFDLTDDSRRKLASDLKEISVEWSPDGSQLCAETSADQPPSELLRMNPIDGSRTVVVDSDTLGVAAIVMQASWSPDGEWLTFSTKVAEGDYDAWLIKADGSDPQLILGGELEQRGWRWSASGEEFLVLEKSASGTYGYYVYDVETGILSSEPIVDGLVKGVDRMDWVGKEYQE